jgi:hypothetical protein
VFSAAAAPATMPRNNMHQPMVRIPCVILRISALFTSLPCC